MEQAEEAEASGPAEVRQRPGWHDRLAAAAWPAAIAGMLLVAYLALHLVAAGDEPYGWEHDLVDAATHIPRPIGAPMEAIMDLANRSLLPLYAALAWLVTRRPPVALAVLLSGLVEGLGIDALKDWGERPRPTGVRLRDHAGGFGLPSGHTAFAFAVAVVVASQLRGWRRAVPLALAAVVGLARMYVGVHYPLDVVGGALWGTAVACAALAAISLALPVARQTAAHG
jgi:membrane-associated phospholipid phosphatase